MMTNEDLKEMEGISHQKILHADRNAMRLIAEVRDLQAKLTTVTLEKDAHMMTIEGLQVRTLHQRALCDSLKAEVERTRGALWSLYQDVLGCGIGDPWDDEGEGRPIPKGFDGELEKFDEAYRRSIDRTNICLNRIRSLAESLHPAALNATAQTPVKNGDL